MPLIKNIKSPEIFKDNITPIKPDTPINPGFGFEADELFQNNINDDTPPPNKHVSKPKSPVATPPIEKVALKKVKQPLKPINFEYNIKSIDEDYKHFNIQFQPSANNIRRQDIDCNVKNMKFKSLFQFESHNNFEDSYYNRFIYLTEDILNNLIEDNQQKEINDIDTYKLILFINVCKNYTSDNEIVDKYELYDETCDIHVIKNYKKFYDGDFSTYFNKTYKDNSVLNNEIMGRIKQFNYHYDKIYPHNFNKNDNPKEYNKVSKNKSNLKTQYRKYLEGNDMDTLNNIPALKMIIYIIDNIEC